jgi:uncharacterized protein YprB with RNaseH-like and TPR domain
LSSSVEAYLDIETTGLSPWCNDVTVVGICVVNNGKINFVQLVGGDITVEGILETLDGVVIVYTYNGSRFDLPFIKVRLGLDLVEYVTHRDLMYDCWQCDLYGGLKSVEKQLGIERKLPEVSGFYAVKLWWRYLDLFDLGSLDKLLEYNREDTLNLKILKERLLYK